MMEGIINVQIDLFNSIKKGLTNFKKSPKDRITKEYVEARLENLESDWALFRSNNTKLFEISKPGELAESVYVVKDIYDNTEENYLLYKSSLKVYLSKFMLSESESQCKKDGHKSSSLVRLPKITIPTFSGDYSEWTTFRDLFMSLVHKNDSLENVQKLHYLKSHLTGEAEQLIRHTPITDANYSLCWSLLEKRYNNKRFLANCILKRLFSQRRMNVETSSGLKELIDTTMDCLNGLKNIDVDVSTWDIIIIHIVTFKLDAETRKQWELQISSDDTNELPSFDQFKCFMESRFRALEFINVKKVQFQHTTGPYLKPKALLSTNVSGMRCEFCAEGHKLCFCKKFIKQSCAQRRDFVAKNAICYNCLGGNHTVYDCKKPTTCRICRKRHHSLLHPEEDKASSNLSTKETVEGTSSMANASQIVSCLSTRRVPSCGHVLLATALVNAESRSSGNHVVRALLDQGSQACFITEATVQLLRLKKESVRGTITGLGGDKPLTSKYIVTVQLQSRIDEEFKLEFKAYVLKNITSYLPEQKVQSVDWIDLENVCLADPQFDTPNKVDILLGANVLSQILKDGVKKSSNGTLIAQNTSFGWILSGLVYACHDICDSNSRISVMHAQVNEDNILKQFWEIEEQSYSTKHLLTEEEQKCENLFTSTTKRTSEGRYIVKLPFRDLEPRCLGGESRRIAVTKFKALENRLANNIDLKKRYIEVINEYLHLGHMRLIDTNDTKQNEAVYLPHHAVVKEDRTTTKVRVVFNASSKNRHGVSLNDTLMVGPKLQSDLRHLVMHWRLHPIVLVADIIKMYRQVRIADEDTLFQRLVWRDDPKNEIKDYELLTVTFGTASAPYLAVKAMNQVSVDEGEHFPLASSRVLQSFYMDDLMTGCSDIKIGIEIFKQMTGLLQKGGFILQEWNSNNDELLSEIRKYENENNIDKKDIGEKENQEQIQNTLIKDNKEIDIKTEENTTKILGITWDRCKDNSSSTR